MSRIIRLRRPDRCADCGAELQAGDRARYYGRDHVYGIECHESPAEERAERARQAAERRAARRAARCSSCHGTGEGYRGRACRSCDGTGANMAEARRRVAESETAHMRAEAAR